MRLFGSVAALLALGCNALVGLNQFSIGSGDGGPTGTGGGNDGSAESATPDCRTNAECTERATLAATARGETDAGIGGMVPAMCLQPQGQCVELLSPDCAFITGDYLNDKAILLGTLFSTKGAQAATNIPRQQSATLAVEEINAVGGIPASSTSGATRPLVVVSCDESTDLNRAATHLVSELHVPAIVGPNTSQDTINVSNNFTIPGGTVVMTPSAVASSIRDLVDNDLTWLMVAADVQRAPLMIQQINELEMQLNTARAKSTLRLGIVYRNDALGKGTATSLNSLIFNGKSLSDAINLGNNVQIDPYDFSQPDQNAIVAKYVTFAPDIIVLAGTAEAITKVMVPLEQQWMAADKPFYVGIDSIKVPELLTAATSTSTDLRARVRGTGITPGPASAPVFNAFKTDYFSRYMTQATVSSMGPSYDAAYAIAYALAATKELPVSGANIAKGLRMLAGGPTVIEVGSTKILAAFAALGSGQKITGIGTFGPLEWDDKGAVVGGTLEVWCIGAPTGTPVYQSSGLTYDIKSATPTGVYKQCSP